ncbi:hypothetical protein BJ875DRAFT_26851 [Amylocarpus encephaloides]|uniref:Secreted protein n=1 Tax=Amylocarpus encephaloides TaxID=45428 RepID=A0A9P7YI55_9HELO|nr:hypothetical protein BJ875DRAFT_26851 [Amylocarpus encephaloides]
MPLLLGLWLWWGANMPQSDAEHSSSCVHNNRMQREMNMQRDRTTQNVIAVPRKKVFHESINRVFGQKAAK